MNAAVKEVFTIKQADYDAIGMFPAFEMDKKKKKWNLVNSKFCQAAYDYAVAAANDYAKPENDPKREQYGGKKNCRLIRLAAKRFLKDLERAKSPDCAFRFDPDEAHRYCKVIELLPHVEGRWETRNLRLNPADCFLVVQIFGFRTRDTNERRFTRVLYAVARKNGKSTKAAAIINAAFLLENELGAQAFCAATTGAQARVVWKIIKEQLRKTPAMRDKWCLHLQANEIIRKDDVGGFIKPINSKASTQDGLNPAYITLDELHAHKTPDLMNVLQSAAGARSCPLVLITTTEGYENPLGPWADERHFGEQVLEDIVEADHCLVIFYRLDDEDDDFDESKWCKANPLMEHNPIILKKNRELAIEAKVKPSSLSEFRIKRLNRRASTANGLVNLDAWRRCSGNIDLSALKGLRCWASFDLAVVTDMNSWRLLWELEEGRYATWGRYWVPEAMVKLRTERNTVPYSKWVKQGWLQVTPGEVTDYDHIYKDIVADYEMFLPEQVAYDPWNATQLATKLDDRGIPIIQFIQGTKSYNPAIKAFERLYVAGNIVHDNNPILNWNMANVIAREDQNKNLAPDRKRSKDKIDGACTLFMCCGLMEANESGYVTGTVVAA